MLILIEISIFLVLLIIIGAIYKLLGKKFNKKYLLFSLFIIAFGGILFAIINEFNANGLTDHNLWIIIPFYIVSLVSLLRFAIKHNK